MHFVELLLNPRGRTSQPYSATQRSILGGRSFEIALETIQGWPGYAPTPLHALPGLARRIGVGAIDYKDESERFGLKSFKALGGAYAVGQLIAGVGDASMLTVTCATDGNHGRSVAWGAHRGGCRSVVFVHANVSDARVQAIRDYGARVVRVNGNYDESVRYAAKQATEHGWTVVSDTSYVGYTDIPRMVMQGYTVLVNEALQSMDGALPTHVFLQGGVGGLAAAVAAHFWEHFGARRPTIVVVEPDRADCLLRSARAGVPITVTGALDTVMAGLACGEPSLIAWEILQHAGDAFMSIRDEAALKTMQLLAFPTSEDLPIVGGESGVAGLAGLMAVAADPVARETLRLGTSSRVLVIGSEGDTDPEFYKRVVGEDAATVLGRSHTLQSVR